MAMGRQCTCPDLPEGPLPFDHDMRPGASSLNPNHTMRMFWTGHYMTAVQMAKLSGLQIAMVSADREVRRRAVKDLEAFTLDCTAFHGLPMTTPKKRTFGVLEDGRICASSDEPLPLPPEPTATEAMAEAEARGETRRLL